MYNTLRQLGVNVKAGDDFIEIEGVEITTVKPQLEHSMITRIAMSSLSIRNGI